MFLMNGQKMIRVEKQNATFIEDTVSTQIIFILNFYHLLVQRKARFCLFNTAFCGNLMSPHQQP